MWGGGGGGGKGTKGSWDEDVWYPLPLRMAAPRDVKTLARKTETSGGEFKEEFPKGGRGGRIRDAEEAQAKLGC